MAQIIGTRHETSLHRDLKLHYSGQDGQTEAAVAGFVVDGISSNGEFIEIQTGSFGPLRRKVQTLAARGRVRIVYPAIISKYIEVFDINGKRLHRRKSPRKGSPWDIFYVLVYAPDLPFVPRLTIEIALVDISEQRVQDGLGSWRRRKVSIHDRRLIALHERIILKKPRDYLRFVPFEQGEQFTSRTLGENAHIHRGLARKALFVLTELGIIEKTGKKGNTFIYQLQKPAETKKRRTVCRKSQTTT